MPSAIHTRVSSDDQADRQLPIESQLTELRSFAAAQGQTIVAEYSDPGVSGTLPPEKRPGLAALLRDAAEGRLDSILVWDISRLARDEDLFGYIRYTLRQHGVSVISLKDQGSQLETSIRVAMAAESVRYTRKAIMRSLNLKAERAEYTGGRAPFGYRWVCTLTPEQLREWPTAKSLPRRREIVPEEAAIVRRIYDLYDPAGAGKPIAEIMRILDIPNFKIRRTLRHPAYAGGYTYGRSYVVNGTQRARADRAHWRIVWGAHEPIVSREQWERVQEQLDRNRERWKIENPGRARLALSGLLRCGACSGALTVHSAPMRRDGSGRRYLYYGCRNPKCGAVQQIPGHTWTDQIIGWLIEQLSQPGMARILSDELNSAYEAGRESGDLEAEVRHLERSARNLLAAIESGEVSDTRELARRYEQKQRSLEIARKALERATRDGGTITSPRVVKARLAALLKDLGRIQKLHDPSRDARQVLHQIAQSIVVDPVSETATLTMRHQAFTILPFPEQQPSRLLRNMQHLRIQWKIAS